MEEIQHFPQSFIERLQFFMEKAGINDNQMTVKAGLSVGLVGKAKASKKGMSSVNIEKILLTYPELNPDWLMTGRGEMIKNECSSDSKQPVAVDERLTAQGVTPELITELLNRITEQAAEIGRLNERIKQLQHRLEKDASDVLTSRTADVG